MPGRPGSAVITIEYPRKGAEPVRVMVEARTDWRGRSLVIQTGQEPEWQAGLVYAAFRWTDGNGPAELMLTWRDEPVDVRVTWRENLTSLPAEDEPELQPLDGLNYAEVSDVALPKWPSPRPW